MSFRPNRRVATRLGMPLAAVALTLFAVGTAAAHVGSVSTITVTQTGPLTVSASGTWSWPAMATAGTLSYPGFAIDWGDVTSGNAVGTFHIGDGTPATNVVMEPTSPAQGSSGTWGGVSHTFARAGTYNVCVIFYDLGTTKPFATTGYHSLQAGGTNHNTDNTVDHHLQSPSMCAVFDASAPPSPGQSVAGATSQPPTPSPFESFQGATGVPTSTLPSTTASLPSAPDQEAPLLALVLLIGSMFGSVVALRMVRLRH